MDDKQCKAANCNCCECRGCACQHCKCTTDAKCNCKEMGIRPAPPLIDCCGQGLKPKAEKLVG